MRNLSALRNSARPHIADPAARYIHVFAASQFLRAPSGAAISNRRKSTQADFSLPGSPANKKDAYSHLAIHILCMHPPSALSWVFFNAGTVSR